MTGARGRAGLFVPVVATLAALLILVGLGAWQLQRRAWKEALIASVQRRSAEAAIALPPASEWRSLTADNFEFTRVRLRAEFTPRPSAAVYAANSALRDDVKSAGYFVFAPARMSDGRRIAINRGFGPDRAYPVPSGPIELIGAVRWPEPPSWFVASHDAAGEVWTVRDPVAMAGMKGWGEIAPFYIELESPEPPGGWPHPAPLRPRLRNDHLQYALTWFGLAAVWAAAFGVWVATRRQFAEPLA